MSTPNPFPSETQEQVEGAALNGSWNPWQGPVKPGFWSGAGFSEDNPLGPIESFALKPLGQATAAGELLLAGAAHRVNAFAVSHFGNEPVIGSFLKDQEQRSAALEQDAQQRVNALTPDPATTGTAVQTIAPLVSGGYRMALGTMLGGPLGGAAAVGTTQAAMRYSQLRQQGVDEKTAAESAGVTGVASAAGAFMPGGWGAGLFSKIATGVGANVAFGVANRYADHQILEAGGYKAMADQEKVWDGVGMVTDALLGGVFGGIAHLHDAAEAGRSVDGQPAPLDTAGARDAALVANLAMRDRDASPGVPVDPASAAAHQAAMQSALTSLLSDEPVDVAHTGIQDATMLERPEDPSMELGRQVIADAFRNAGVADAEGRLADLEQQMAARLSPEGAPVRGPAKGLDVAKVGRNGGPKWILTDDWEPYVHRGETAPRVYDTQAEAQAEVERLQAGRKQPEVVTAADIPRNEAELSPQERAIETRFAEQLARDPAAAEAAYAKLPDAGGGKVLNTDTARELSPDYLADRTKSAAVHEPASWLVKRMYARMLREPLRPGEDRTVLFTGGGTGAGKSTAVKESLGDIADRAHIVMDTNLNGFESAVKKIKQATEAGYDVRIVYVYRHPVEALENGALPRAMRQEARHGSGRTVPIEEHLKTHVGSNETIRRLAEHYAGNPHVDITVIDNSRGKGNAGVVDLSNLPEHAYNDVRDEAHQTLERELEAGRISPAVYRGFAGREPPRVAATPEESPGVGEAAGGELEPGRPEGNADQLGGESKPAAAPGIHNVMTATGRRIAVAPKVVELGDLITSDHPEYPQELQPRQRGARAALTEQVRGIARNLNPELLGNAPEADRGAPITGPGNVVESGNGRAFALREVYANHPEKAAEYRAYLEKLGYQTEGLKEPVLVRQRLTQLEGAERRAFTVEANQTSVAALSPVERAQADARLLDASSLSQLRNGELWQAQNAPFVRSFLERLPEAERNELVNPDGTISQAGVRRLQAAVLAKAYGGAPESNAVLGRMLESTDGDLRSTMGAMMDAAPAFAKLRQSIEDGKIGPEYDLSKAITQAVETVAQMREKGQALGEFLKQGDFLTRRPAVVDALMKALYDRKGERVAARDKVATRLMNYADRAIKQRLDQGMLFGDRPVSPEQLLAADEETAGSLTPEPKPGSDMFGLRTPQGKAKPPTGPAAVAAQALERNPNLEIPDAAGEPQRARAELMAADENADQVKERAKPATDAAATCFGQRAA